MPVDLATFVSALKASADLAKASKEILHEENEDLLSKVTYHIKSIEVWSGRVQTLGMLEPLATPDVTIPLLINSAPRTFLKLKSGASLSENDIIDNSNNYLILGDPGSGKTTTVKRLIRKVLTEAPVSDDDKVSFPLLVIARELKVGQTLFREIADILGLEYIFQEHSRSDTSITEFGLRNRKEHGVRSGDYYYKGRRLENVIHEFLNEARVLLFVDGIDEIDPESRPSIESELGRMARGDGIKIVVTCRSGEFGKSQFEGFNVVEIAPLTDLESKEIINRWARDPSGFVRDLDAAPYRDSSNRPLFLTQL
ncbi:MAG: NACHT domain-containing protein, partial [Alphaproteobacteria bacterium]|nr:NACHT domain-containing protein [Alphaproteobacteria bacterium]